MQRPSGVFCKYLDDFWKGKVFLKRAQWVTDFFNISAWIVDFVYFGVRIAEINLAVCFNFFCLTLELD